MNSPIIDNKKWNETKSKIKAKFSNFTDDEIESVKGDLNLLVAIIERVYGVAKDQAHKQFDEFKKSIASFENEGGMLKSTEAQVKPGISTEPPVVEKMKTAEAKESRAV